MFRRPSGVYVARLVVPVRLRPLAGRRELVRSTGSRDAAVAKVIAAGVLAVWRRSLQDLELGDSAAVDLLQLKTGSPRLRLPGYVPLHEARAASGIDEETLIRAATDRRLSLFIDPGMCPGFVVPVGSLNRDPGTGGYEIPPTDQMPADAFPVVNPGTVQLSPPDVPLLVSDLIEGVECELVAFTLPAQPNTLYCPKDALPVRRRDLLLRTDQVERLRGALAGTITKEQFEAARKRSQTASTRTSKGYLHVSDVLADFMAERARRCAPDQARRIRAACELFAELVGNPEIGAVDRAMLRNYRDKLLPQVPAHENKIRLQYGTTSIKASIAKVAGQGWPTLSAAEVAKRMQWVADLFDWLHQERWIVDNPSSGLARAVRPKKTASASKARDLFSRDDLAKIFSAEWFRTGRGRLTRASTYRDFLPYYYWLPLLGLYHGARINELCQLHLSDIRQTASGTWYIDIAKDSPSESDNDKRKRLKNANSARRVPVHPHLVELGLLHWCDALRAQGHQRLFPELLYNDRRGHSAAAVKWFSGYLRRLGWPRTGKKVFHSFRHTLASECLNALGLSEQLTAQISGHARGTSVLSDRYRKDVAIDKLAADVARLDFGLKGIAPFDVKEGLKALEDALRRKERRQCRDHVRAARLQHEGARLASRL